MTDTVAPTSVRPGSVAAEPYTWPYDGVVDPTRTALINIDWQTDFCGPGGYVDAMGYDLNLTRAGLEPTAPKMPPDIVTMAAAGPAQPGSSGAQASATSRHS